MSYVSENLFLFILDQDYNVCHELNSYKLNLLLNFRGGKNTHTIAILKRPDMIFIQVLLKENEQ